MKQAIVKGKIEKRAYCPNCFSIVTWDSPEAEKNNVIKCPACQGSIKYQDAEVIFSNYLENEEVKIIINGIAYSQETLNEGLKKLAKEGGELVLTTDLVIEEPFALNGQDVTIELNGHNLDFKNHLFAVNHATLIVNGRGGKMLASSNNLIKSTDAHIILNEGTYEAKKWGIEAFKNCKIEINNVVMKCQEGCVVPYEGTTVVINDSTLTSLDNYVVGTNGRKTEKGIKKYITINNSILNGEIVTEGYISCGIFGASDAKIVVKGGEINSKSGCGVLVRAGSLELNNVKISAHGNIQGKVGDSTVKIGCDGAAYDTQSNYPDKDTAKLIINKGTSITCENEQRIGLYLNEGEEPNIVDKSV